MSVIAYVIVLAATGLLIGAIARLVLPGPDPMTLPETMLVGIAGSFSAGLIARLLFGSPGAGILLSVIAATGIVSSDGIALASPCARLDGGASAWAPALPAPS